MVLEMVKCMSNAMNSNVFIVVECLHVIFISSILLYQSLTIVQSMYYMLWF